MFDLKTACLLAELLQAVRRFVLNSEDGAAWRVDDLIACRVLYGQDTKIEATREARIMIGRHRRHHNARVEEVLEMQGYPGVALDKNVVPLDKPDDVEVSVIKVVHVNVVFIITAHYDS